MAENETQRLCWRAGCVAENVAQRLGCRMPQTGKQAVWLRM